MFKIPNDEDQQKLLDFYKEMPQKAVKVCIVLCQFSGPANEVILRMASPIYFPSLLALHSPINAIKASPLPLFQGFRPKRIWITTTMGARPITSFALSPEVSARDSQ